MADRQTHTSDEIPNPIQIQKYLSDIDYPTDKQNLLKHAEKEGADDKVMDALRQLPDESYDSPVAVSREIGKMK
jgi:hypothetical protein